MRPSRAPARVSLAAPLVLASSCGKARSNPPVLHAPNDVLALGCDGFGAVYALSRASATSLPWRSRDDRLSW